jgi:hypothetical protein
MAESFKTPFNMLIVGMTGSGKTHYLLDSLERDYSGHFDLIFLICPTYAHNRTYLQWKFKDDPDFLPIHCDQDDVELWLKEIVSIAGGMNSLIIVDDAASSQSVKNRTSELVRLAFSARHYGLSTIVITQQLTSICKPYRENVARLVCFFNPNRSDMLTIFNDYLGTAERDEKDEIWRTLKEHKHARLEIDLRFPFGHRIVKP